MTLTKIGSRPVVVKCDGSVVSQNAVAVATRQAARQGAPLVLLATRAERSQGGDRPPWTAQPEAAIDSPSSVAERAWWRVNHTDPTVAVQIVTVTDPRSPSLATLAASARLLVLAGADVQGASPAALRPNDRALNALFRCPVLLAGPAVRAREDRPPAVVVGFSGASEDAQLMPPALVEAKLRDAQVVVVGAVPSTDRLEPAMDESWSALRTHCRDIPCRVVHLVAEPARALADQAGPGDLLVIGSNGSSPVERLAGATIVRETTRLAKCDVLVLPLRQVAKTTLNDRATEGSLALETR